jgi:hypothetical protein
LINLQFLDRESDESVIVYFTDHCRHEEYFWEDIVRKQGRVACS